MKKSHIYHLFLILIFLGTTSCAQSAESTPNVWIDYPLDGDIFSIGETVPVSSHVFAKEGVADVILSVNGEAYRIDTPVEVGQTFTDIKQDWVPSETGVYILRVQIYDSQGKRGNPASVSVEIKGDSATQPPPLVDTPVPLVETLAPSATPVPTNTFPPPTVTLPPPTVPPADTTPPPVPMPVVPAEGLVLECRATQNLVWLPVEDPSGISGYYVKLEKEISAGNWQSAGAYDVVANKQVEVNVQCGLHYRWMVRAEDGAENFSAWSAPSHFAINLE